MKEATLYKIGEPVWWVSIGQSTKIERAGYVAAIVPAGHEPTPYVPEGMRCKLRGGFRTHQSYLIKVPDMNYVFWPQVASLNEMTPDKEHLIYSQPKGKLKFILKVNREDREAIKDAARIFGGHMVETKEMIEVAEWKTRFWFGVENLVEYIIKVDRW
jgi:hypothetical protein